MLHGYVDPIVHLISTEHLGLIRRWRADADAPVWPLFSRIAFGAFRLRPDEDIDDRSARAPYYCCLPRSTAACLAALLFGLGFAGIMPCYPLLIRILFPDPKPAG